MTKGKSRKSEILIELPHALIKNDLDATGFQFTSGKELDAR